MMLKIVYGPPPADVERIEAAEEIGESALVHEESAAVPGAQGMKVSGNSGQGGAWV